MKRCLAVLGLALVLPLTSLAAEPIHLKFAVPASLTTPRGVVAQRFVDEVAKRTGGNVVFDVYPDSQLFAGAEEPKAISTGAIDVAVPNMALIGSIEPNADIFAMPAFLGVSATQLRAVLDGPTGRDLSARIEKRLGAKVLGAGFDTGPDVIVTAKKDPKSLADLNGLKLRAPGGSKYSARLQAIGATPVFIRFEELPLALTQGTVDGVMTNDAGVVQGKLWELGVKYVVRVDFGWAPLLPMMSQRAWDKIGAENQKIVVAAWADILPWARAFQDEQLALLRKQMIDSGVAERTPTPEEVKAIKAKLDALQPALVTETRVDAKLLADMTAALQAAAPKN